MEARWDNCHGHHTLGIRDTGNKYIPFISEYLSKDPKGRAKSVNALITALQFTFPFASGKLRKVKDYLKTIETTSEERLVEDLKYHTRVICLVTDLAYMGAGEVSRPYEEQIQEAIFLKKKYAGRVKVFVMLDPNRPNLIDLIKKYNADIDGYKLYPTWYFVTDYRLRPIFDSFPKPVVVHCTDTSTVFWQGSRDKLKLDLGEQYKWCKSKKENCAIYSHPKHVYYMTQLYTNIAWSCAHYGGENEEYKAYIRKRLGGNFFTDDSYTYDTAKENIQLNEEIEENVNIMHGTDYYMTKMEGDYETIVGNYEYNVYIGSKQRQKDWFDLFLNWK